MQVNFNPQIKNYNLSALKSAKKSTADYTFDNNFSYGQTKTIAFSGNFFSKIFSLKPPTQVPDKPFEIPKPYTADVTKGLNSMLGYNFSTDCLKCLLDPDELRKIIPNLNCENFQYNKRNVENGIYCADLDYQTSFSDGQENIFDILDDVALLADEHMKQTGKPFIFALTDRDSLEGLQHAIRIIASDPDKYKNVRFVPGIKLSFAHEAPNSNLGYESSDMLIYGINPFSENLISFVESTIQKRKAMTVDFIKKINELYPEFAYSVVEFAKQNRIKYKKDFAISNLYWRAREYAETKGDTAIRGISMVPEDILKDAQDILNELHKVYLGSSQKGFSALGSSIIKDDEVNKSIKQVFDEYSTHYDEDVQKVVSSDDNLYQDMIECLSKEPIQPVLAICDPYYFSHYFQGEDKFNQVIEFFKTLIKNSKNMLYAFESVSPRYSKDTTLTADQIKQFNKLMRDNLSLYEVGGSFAKRLS